MTDHDAADMPEPAQSRGKRTRRAEPISKRVAKNGTVSYEFRADLGAKPDGSRDRRRFTYRTLAEARKELRRITSEVAAGTYNRPTAISVDEACDEWLAGRRGIRRVTLYSYEMDLKPVRRYLGNRKLQALTKADGDALVRWMLTEARTSPKHYLADSLAGRVVALVSEHPEGINAADLAAALPGDVHSALSATWAAMERSRSRHRHLVGSPWPGSRRRRGGRGCAQVQAQPPRSTATGGCDRGAAGTAPAPADRGPGARRRVVRRPTGGRA